MLVASATTSTKTEKLVLDVRFRYCSLLKEHRLARNSSVASSLSPAEALCRIVVSCRSISGLTLFSKVCKACSYERPHNFPQLILKVFAGSSPMFVSESDG